MKYHNLAQRVCKTPQDVTEICDYARKAIDELPMNAIAKTRFKWRGKSYIARETVFSLYVEDTKGNPIACRAW